MMLIIGQAPAEKKQTVPYDTTYLYTMLDWAGIGKEDAQLNFDFDAAVNVFPGKREQGGHKAPGMADIEQYWNTSLKSKVEKAEKIIVLGDVAKKALCKLGLMEMKEADNILFLIHPSRRNTGRILKSKDAITKQLKEFIYPR